MTCKIAGCERAVTARQMCRKHYLAEWRAGSIDSSPLRDRTSHECPSDHPHDLVQCWASHGCRCARCRHLRKMERQRRRNRLTAYGRADQITPPRVAAGQVREHIRSLQSAGIGLERVAAAAQVSNSTVFDIIYGRRGAGRSGEISTIRMSHAERLLAVTAESAGFALHASVGTVRRLRALVAIGYTETELADSLGMLVGNFSGLIMGKRARVTSATYKAVARVFADLWDKPLKGGWANAARRNATAHGWFGPLAWDDIDDPNEAPNVRGGEETVDIDETAVELAMAGETVRLSPRERREAVTRLHGERWSDSRIAQTLGVADRTVLRIRQELGLEAFDQTELRNVS